jgi:hypothetical protein
MWLHQVYLNIHLVYETCLVMSFIVIGKGWCTTRMDIEPVSWNRIFIFGAVFYMTNSVIVVGKKTFMSNRDFFFVSLIVYGLAYALILTSTLTESAYMSKTITAVLREPPSEPGANGVSHIALTLTLTLTNRFLFLNSNTLCRVPILSSDIQQISSFLFYPHLLPSM